MDWKPVEAIARLEAQAKELTGLDLRVTYLPGAHSGFGLMAGPSGWHLGDTEEEAAKRLPGLVEAQRDRMEYWAGLDDEIRRQHETIG